MSRIGRAGVFALGLAMLAVMVFMQKDIDPKRDRLQSFLGTKKQAKLIFQLPGPYVLATFTGMRETVASILWVRCDEFFHEGNFEAIMPLVRIITWLDPHYIDVYKTGAWHLDYNITDSSERSDRRYIPAALALMMEGIANNNDTFDLPFDLGFVHYNNKIRDWKSAIYWLEVAGKKPDLNPRTNKQEHYPMVVKRMLAHMYEKNGDIEKSKAKWREILPIARKLAKKYPNDYNFATDLSVTEQNYNLMLWRDEHRKWDTNPIVDARFEAKWVRKKPKVIVVSGVANLISREDYLTLNPKAGAKLNKDSMRVRLEALAREEPGWANGARVDITLTDLGYKRPTIKEFNWEVPKDVTIAVDAIRFAHGKFEIEMDLSRDPHIYAFKSKKYKLTVTIDPRAAPDYIQDRIGWRGEGMTDKKYLDTKTVPGVRMLRKEWIINREDLV